MVSYKAVLSKIFTRSSSLNIADDTSSPYRRSPPSRTLSFPTLPSPKLIFDEPSSIPPRAPRILVRRHHSSNPSVSSTRSFLSKFRSNSISIPNTIRPHTLLLSTSPIASLAEEDFASRRPSIPFLDDTPSPTSSVPVVPELSDIDLLLSNEPGDAKKAIIKRLEGLTLALEDVTSSTSSGTYRKKPSISFHGLPFHVSESLSPIENWEDDDPMKGNLFGYCADDEDEAGSSSRSRSSSSDSCSSSSWTSNAEDAKPPLTPSLTAAQYPLSFRLEPIPQLTLDICKSTPPPVCPREISEHSGFLLPVEQHIVVSWDTEQHPP